MITEALQHCRGIGPVRLSRLCESGVRTWNDVLDYPDRLPASCRDEMIRESRRCLAALEARNIHYFVNEFAAQDKWRILAHYLDDASFFDIETLGLEHDDPITVIVCWHRGCPLVFVEHENLDDFLDLLDEVRLLVSFNGSSFDVPRVLDAFHIPRLPCAHLDLRWSCYHRGLRGGLKDIARRTGINRPVDLENADGELAVRLWTDWQNRNDYAARQQLIRYCTADVLLLVLLADQLLGPARLLADEIWSHLPSGGDSPIVEPPASSTEPAASFAKGPFGPGSPGRLRALRARVAG